MSAAPPPVIQPAGNVTCEKSHLSYLIRLSVQFFQEVLPWSAQSQSHKFKPDGQVAHDPGPSQELHVGRAAAAATQAAMKTTGAVKTRMAQILRWLFEVALISDPLAHTTHGIYGTRVFRHTVKY